MTDYGYGRVSTRDQNPDSQRDALLEAGVAPERIYVDRGRSGSRQAGQSWTPSSPCCSRETRS